MSTCSCLCALYIILCIIHVQRVMNVDFVLIITCARCGVCTCGCRCSHLYLFQDKEDPFYMVDVGRLLLLHEKWEESLPSVHPFYAVKCNNDPVLLQTLAQLGCGFDCASKVREWQLAVLL